MTTHTRNGNQASRARPKPEAANSQVAPHNLDAERSVLGCCLIGQGDTIDLVTPIIRPADFHISDHGEVFAALLAFRGAGKAIDPITVGDSIAPVLRITQGQAYDLLMDLQAAVPHAIHAQNYASKVASAARRRETICAATELNRAAHDLTVDIEDTISAADSGLISILERSIEATDVPFSETVREVVTSAGQPISPRIPTGFCDLDRIIGGLSPGRLTILAARTSIGKTSFAANIVFNVAKSGTGVLVFSLEESKADLAERFVCSIAKISSKTFNSRNRSEAVCDSIATAGNALEIMPLTVDDTPRRTISDITSTARVNCRRKNIGLVVIDYLQLISPEDKRIPREQQVAEISRGLKLMAGSLKVPVITLAQLNRNVETRPDKRPRLADLRESGAIEQDADMVWFLDRPSADDSNADASEATLYVAKHRKGEKGEIKLNWHADSATFRDAAHPRVF